MSNHVLPGDTPRLTPGAQKVKIYALYDRIAQIFLPPFTARNDLVATREFRTVANNKVLGNTVASNTEDYDLFYLGEYEQTTGAISTDTRPLIVAAGTQLIGEQKEPQ